MTIEITKKKKKKKKKKKRQNKQKQIKQNIRYKINKTNLINRAKDVVCSVMHIVVLGVAVVVVEHAAVGVSINAAWPVGRRTPAAGADRRRRKSASERTTAGERPHSDDRKGENDKREKHLGGWLLRLSLSLRRGTESGLGDGLQ